jgi:glycosyltransferase involved in cell wall biosynthesis
LRIISEQIPEADLDMLFQSADIYWYPAHSLMSISVLEAMSHGLPVVTTNYYDNAEYVEDGRTGMIVPQRRDVPPWDTSELEVRSALEVSDPEFVQALVQKTAVLIENKDLRRRMGRAARADVETKFSLAEKNHKFKNIFDRAIEPQDQEKDRKW